MKTLSLPIGLTYFDPSGFFSGTTATFVDQKVQRSPTVIAPNATRTDGTDRFVVVDAVAGYRLGKRLGVVSLVVKNLFDQKFKYQDDSYREFRDEPSTGPYFPRRMVMVRFGLSF